MDERKLPAFNYYVDESDSDIVVLRRQDDAFVAAFSAQGAAKEGILEAAKEDYRALIEANKDTLAPSATEQRKSA
jgi:hypothetical protein